MDSTLKLFLIGFLVGTSSLIFANIGGNELFWNESENYFTTFLSLSGTVWILAFMLMIVTTLPFVAIESLKKRFTRKQYLPFPFMAGNGFGFLTLQIIAIILKLIN